MTDAVSEPTGRSSDPPQLVAAPPPPAAGRGHQCAAHSRSGARCGQPAVPGATVCRYHGGTAPQVRRAAQLRLLELVDPAVATLARELTNSRARPIERIKAAEKILEFAGMDKGAAIDGEVSRQFLVERLVQLRDELEANLAGPDPGEPGPAAGRELIAGEVVDGSDGAEDNRSAPQ